MGKRKKQRKKQRAEQRAEQRAKQLMIEKCKHTQKPEYFKFSQEHLDLSKGNALTKGMLLSPLIVYLK